MERDLASMRKRIFGVTLSFVVVAAGLTWLLTRRYVSRPLARMVADMRSVRVGNLSLAHPTHRADEVGDARVEFDYLVRDLDAARIRADQEAEARRAIERGLQDADKLITLGQLAAVMAHEIGSPLQILEGRTRALRKHAEDSDATRRTADLLVEQTGRITRIVEQMLSITRSCRGNSSGPFTLFAFQYFLSSVSPIWESTVRRCLSPLLCSIWICILVLSTSSTRN